jgi:hypothetical protein
MRTSFLHPVFQRARTVQRAAPGLAAIMILAPWLMAFDFLEAMLAPKAELWARWEAHDPSARANIDHGPWGAFLATYLSTGEDGVNRIAYARVTPAHRRMLRAYLASLSAVPIRTYRREEQLAYWVNLYNALTVELVLKHFPVKSIRDISDGLFSYGPWERRLIEVEGQSISLSDIEHRILRPIWNDPRIHYVINCAALGCPNLPSLPLTAANAEAMLDAAAREYVNHPRGVRSENGKLVVSKIYNWFSADFGPDVEAVVAHLRRYAEPPLAGLLKDRRIIRRYEYDWSLNAASDGGAPPR